MAKKATTRRTKKREDASQGYFQVEGESLEPERIEAVEEAVRAILRARDDIAESKEGLEEAQLACKEAMNEHKLDWYNFNNGGVIVRVELSNKQKLSMRKVKETAEAK